MISKLLIYKIYNISTPCFSELNEEDLPVIKNPLDKTRGNNIQKISIIEFTNISSFLKFFYKLELIKKLHWNLLKGFSKDNCRISPKKYSAIIPLFFIYKNEFFKNYSICQIT